MNRSDEDYADKLKSNLTSLSERWDTIIALTAAQKENLRNASLKFQEISNGVKDVMHYLKDVEKDVEKDNLVQTDDAMLKTLLDRYQVLKIFIFFSNVYCLYIITFLLATSGWLIFGVKIPHPILMIKTS